MIYFSAGMVLLHCHVMMRGKLEGDAGRVIQIPIGRGGVIIIARACPAEVVHDHAEARVKPDLVFDMESVQHEALLRVVLCLGIAEDSV